MPMRVRCSVHLRWRLADFGFVGVGDLSSHVVVRWLSIVRTEPLQSLVVRDSVGLDAADEGTSKRRHGEWT
jgi:hypothetical protein